MTGRRSRSGVAVAVALAGLLVLAGCAAPNAPGAGGSAESTPTGTGAETGTTAAETTTAPAETVTAPRTPTLTPEATTAASAADPPPTATFVVGGERRATVTLEVANTSAERRRGLMYRRSLAPDRGMVFVYDEAAPRSFWMKNTYVPLDMIFVGSDGRVINVAHATPQPRAPESALRSYRSDAPAKYVIEVRRGFANRTGIRSGTRVRFANAHFETPEAAATLNASTSRDPTEADGSVRS